MNDLMKNIDNPTLDTINAVLDLLKVMDPKKYENIKWALEWNMMNWNEAIKYIETGVWAV